MPEPQTNGWRPSHSGIHHTLHSYAQAGGTLDHFCSFESAQKRCRKMTFVYVVFAALHSEQWAAAIWNLCTNCGIWLWWNAQAVSDRPVRDLPCLEGEDGCYCLLLQSLICYSISDFVCFLGVKGKCNWTQCKNCKGVPREELHRWSHCWGQRGHQAGDQSPARGKAFGVRGQTSLSWMTVA